MQLSILNLDILDKLTKNQILNILLDFGLTGIFQGYLKHVKDVFSLLMKE